MYDTPSGKTNLSFNPEIIGYNDYYPFGMLVPNRHGQADSYRYGFQGQEKDDEVKGEGNSINYRFRMHDPRVGRFFAVDPLTAKYPHYTPYSFSGNKVIAFGELEGLEEWYRAEGEPVDIDLVDALNPSIALQSSAAALANTVRKAKAKLFGKSTYTRVTIKVQNYVDVMTGAKAQGSIVVAEEVNVYNADPKEAIFDTVEVIGNSVGLGSYAKETSKLAGVFLAKSSTKGTLLKKIAEGSFDVWKNLMPNSLKSELDRAAELGVEVMGLGSSKFDDMIVEGPLKFIVDKNGSMKIMNKFKNGEEISHAVLSKGESVLAAGEMMLAGSKKTGYFVLEITNHSGHFQPDLKSLEIAKEALKDGIDILNDF
ncbi:RHS repeat domain-containing protein [Tenacibaculum maritimum]|uniref:RHS repeat domain-containing protein n=1 Tax=Tenacibaculum maritimum TaxID=107401 RepID=UPI00132FEC1E|nr:RHS repeat-associated core domain-containing protein [Tenacibaculum maritimum]